MNPAKLSQNTLNVVGRLLRLKDVVRAGWTRHDIPEDRVESVADHSYGVALLSLLLCPPELNREKVLELAILHDLAEVEVGDITPHDGVTVQEKQRRESESAARIFADLPEGESLLESFHECMRGETPEARWVKAVDKLEMSLQSLNYERDFGLDLAEFRESSREALSEFGLESPHLWTSATGDG